VIDEHRIPEGEGARTHREICQTGDPNALVALFFARPKSQSYFGEASFSDLAAVTLRDITQCDGGW